MSQEPRMVLGNINYEAERQARLAKKAALTSKIFELTEEEVEEFFNECHGEGGLFCEGSSTTNTAKPKSVKRSWIDKPGKQPMTIVYHEATRAGAHIDTHIGNLSIIHRVKPELQEKLKFNSTGALTGDSKKAILDHVRHETQNRSRVPQNLDHTLGEARQSWVKGDPTDKSYGAGKTRQIIHESTVDVYKAGKDSPIEMYAPALNPNKAMYLHKLYSGDEKRAPILIFGAKANKPPKLGERLHLKSVSPDNVNKLEGMTTIAKYDGASAHVVIGPKGTTIWSPRTNKKTGEPIEYTPKLGELSHIKSKETVVGMGELLFTREGKKGYLSAAETGGILNSHKLLPEGVKPEIRLYRIDKVGRKVVKDLPFEVNQEYQVKTAGLAPKHLKPVETMSPETTKKRGFEGVVGVPKGKSINEGYKVKWRADANDWEIEKVDFKPGEKGGIAGVAHLKSLESGKKFKLGPGQVGNHKLVRHMMKYPSDYSGVVVKVHSNLGHEGRASKVIDFHMDKGVAPPSLTETDLFKVEDSAKR